MAERLSGKRIFLTGAAQGIGLAIAEAAAEGADCSWSTATARCWTRPWPALPRRKAMSDSFGLTSATEPRLLLPSAKRGDDIGPSTR